MSDSSAVSVELFGETTDVHAKVHKRLEEVAREHAYTLPEVLDIWDDRFLEIEAHDAPWGADSFFNDGEYAWITDQLRRLGVPHIVRDYGGYTWPAAEFGWTPSMGESYRARLISTAGGSNTAVPVMTLAEVERILCEAEQDGIIDEGLGSLYGRFHNQFGDNPDRWLAWTE